MPEDLRNIGQQEPNTSVQSDGTIVFESDDGSQSITINTDGSIDTSSISADSVETLDDLTDDNGNTIYDYSNSQIPTSILEALTASDISDVSPDSTGDAHHSKYTDENAQDAIGTILGANFTYDDSGNAISLSSDSVTIEGNSVSLGGTTSVNHNDLSSISSNDHHSKTSSASELSDVSPDSTGDAHHSKTTSSEIDHDSTTGGTDSNAHHNPSLQDVESVDGYDIQKNGIDGNGIINFKT